MENGIPRSTSENFEASIVYKYLMENGLIQTLNTFAQEVPHNTTSWCKGKQHKESIPRLEDLVADYQKTNQPRYAHYHLQALLQDYTELQQARGGRGNNNNPNKRKALSSSSTESTLHSAFQESPEQQRHSHSTTTLMNNSLSMDESVLTHILRTPKRKKLERRLSGRPVKPAKPSGGSSLPLTPGAGRHVMTPGVHDLELDDHHAQDNPLQDIDIDEALKMIEY